MLYEVITVRSRLYDLHLGRGKFGHRLLYPRDKHLEIPHALMVTSAEAEDGTIGFRVMLNGEPLPSFELKERFEASRTDRFDAISGNGRLQEINLSHPYLRWLLHGARPANDSLSVLWDAGNGAIV